MAPHCCAVSHCAPRCCCPTDWCCLHGDAAADDQLDSAAQHGSCCVPHPGISCFSCFQPQMKTQASASCALKQPCLVPRSLQQATHLPTAAHAADRTTAPRPGRGQQVMGSCIALRWTTQRQGACIPACTSWAGAAACHRLVLRRTARPHLVSISVIYWCGHQLPQITTITAVKHADTSMPDQLIAGQPIAQPMMLTSYS